MNPALRSLMSVLLVLTVLIGIGFRFYHLDKKVFWMDETSTAQWMAGYSLPEIRTALAQRPYWLPFELEPFQKLNPGRGIGMTRHALATDDPKHPPLFYLLLRAWAGFAGDSVFALRLLPALLSLLVLPSMGWLCRELFFDDPRRNTISLVALALVALSPIHVLYAQEAREYSLWTALMLASSALLLRAQRNGGWKWWAAYAFSLALGLYTHTLFLLLWLAHATFIGGLWWQRRRAENAGRDRVPGNRLPAFGIATLGAALLFLPWAMQISARQSELSSNSAWLAQSSSFPYLLKTWVFLLGSLFFDPNQTQYWNLDNNLLVVAVRLARGLFFLLIAGALFFVGRRATRRSALFIIALAIVPFLALAIPDTVLGGYRSTIARFMLPAFLGMQLAVAYSIATTLRAPSTSRRSAAACGALLFAGFLSCLLSSQAQVWWNKSASYNVPRVARIINATEKPLLVIAPNPNFFALCRLLKPQVRLLVLRIDQTHGNILPLLPPPQKTTPVFFYRPTPQLRAALQEQGAQLTPSPGGDDLLLLEKS